MSNSFPVEALKAQAVCARGYATSQADARAQKEYDVKDTSADQVYHGYVAAYTRAIEAVNKYGLIGAFVGGVTRAAAGITAAVVFGLINALLFKPHAKS